MEIIAPERRAIQGDMNREEVSACTVSDPEVHHSAQAVRPSLCLLLVTYRFGPQNLAMQILLKYVPSFQLWFTEKQSPNFISVGSSNAN